jgi:hypothetical protein
MKLERYKQTSKIVTIAARSEGVRRALRSGSRSFSRLSAPYQSCPSSRYISPNASPGLPVLERKGPLIEAAAGMPVVACAVGSGSSTPEGDAISSTPTPASFELARRQPVVELKANVWDSSLPLVVVTSQPSQIMP